VDVGFEELQHLARIQRQIGAVIAYNKQAIALEGTAHSNR
jgi:hypothetical protein